MKKDTMLNPEMMADELFVFLERIESMVGDYDAKILVDGWNLLATKHNWDRLKVENYNPEVNMGKDMRISPETMAYELFDFLGKLEHTVGDYNTVTLIKGYNLLASTYSWDKIKKVENNHQ